MTWYLDSSAIMKLVLAEKESKALRSFLHDPITSSLLSRVEVVRNVHRINPSADEVAQGVLKTVNFFPLSTTVIRIAESVSKLTTLKTLDAIQVATALSVAGDIEGIISYDRQLSLNAEQLGLKVFAPA